MLQLSQTWHDMLIPTHSVAEMIARGTSMYLVIFAMMRFILKRQSGGLSTPDVLRPAPLILIENGKVLRRDMRQELVAMDELLVCLREEGSKDPPTSSAPAWKRTAISA